MLVSLSKTSYIEPNSQIINVTESDRLIESMNSARSATTAKREIHLPKTKFTRKGQLLLYTDDQEEPVEARKIIRAKPSPPNSQFLQKTFSKKWLDDLTDISLNANLFLNENKDSMNKQSNDFFSGKLGKNTDFFVHELRKKSGFVFFCFYN
jgi:hypothetical protein